MTKYFIIKRNLSNETRDSTRIELICSKYVSDMMDFFSCNYFKPYEKLDHYQFYRLKCTSDLMHNIYGVMSVLLNNTVKDHCREYRMYGSYLYWRSISLEVILILWATFSFYLILTFGRWYVVINMYCVPNLRYDLVACLIYFLYDHEIFQFADKREHVFFLGFWLDVHNHYLPCIHLIVPRRR